MSLRVYFFSGDKTKIPNNQKTKIYEIRKKWYNSNMKLKKEIYFLGVLFIFVLGYFLGQNNSFVEDDKVEKNFATQNSSENKPENKPEKLYKVWEVIDGDTIKINYEGKKTSVRIVGINTPETNGPYRGKECFGEEASKKAKEILWGKNILVEFDSSQSKWDRYGRLLGYILIDGKKDFGLEMIKTGYAYENTYKGKKYKNQKIYKDAQKYAEKNKLGLWAENTCSGNK